MRLEVDSLLYGILADEDLIQIVLDAARAAEIENTTRLRAEFQLRLADYRLLGQYGDLDQGEKDSDLEHWDCDTS